jgi:hypothetical protein
MLYRTNTTQCKLFSVHFIVRLCFQFKTLLNFVFPSRHRQLTRQLIWNYMFLVLLNSQNKQ